MKKLFTVLLALCITLQLLAQGQSKHALFIGNSYTEVNNLPYLVSQVASSMGDTLTYQANTPGGCTFQQHCNNQSMTLIQQGGWDIVVLQEQSQYPSFPQSQVQNEVFPYAAQLVQAVYTYSPCAEPMFYMTWGRRDGDQQNAQFFPVLGTYQGMDSMLYERYLYMAKTNDASLCPVGRVWRSLRTSHPDIELYSGDGSHPSMAGSYAAACAFYAMMFQRSPLTSSFNASLNDATASIIRSVVDSVVCQQFAFWQRPLPQASFDTLRREGTVCSNVFDFENNSSYADRYFWDFGDGDTSDFESPNHAFPNLGTYTITLVASRHCMSDTATLILTIAEPVAIHQPSAPTFHLYPNPTTNSLWLKSEVSAPAQVFDLTGRLLFSVEVVEGVNRIDLQRLIPGRYLLRLADRSLPFVKQ